MLPLAAFAVFFLAGCFQPNSTPQPPTATGPTAESVLAAYHPRTVHLFHIDVNATVEEPFPSQEGSQSFHSWFYSLNATSPYTTQNKTLSDKHISALWLVQDNDTVIYGTYRLHSNKHDVFDEHLTVSDTLTAAINLGGIDFRAVVESDRMAMGVFGPFNLYSSVLTLANFGSPAPVQVSIPHESIFPMLNRTGGITGSVAFEHRHVNATVTFANWGKATYQMNPKSYSDVLRNPKVLSDRLAPEQLVPGGRIGQVSSWCSGFVLKAPAPCMNPWEHPLV
jgi:hypothetical protein